MRAGKLHIVNARLPLNGDDRWYELIAEDGRWISVVASTEKTVRHDAVSIASKEAIGADGRAASAVDLEGRIAVPGFVDMHMHLDKALSLPRVGNASGTLLEAISNYGQHVDRFSKEEIRERIIRTAKMGLRHGTVHMRTHLDMHAWLGRDIMFRTVEAALEAKEALKGHVQLQLFPMLSFGQVPRETAELAKELIGLGMDGIGGCPHLNEDPEADIRHLFDIATRLDVPIDLHVDERDDPFVRTVIPIARMTREYGYEGRVTAGHLCSLSSMPSSEARPIIEEMARAKVGAVTLPAANLYLQGRADDGPIRRGVTRVKELLEAGVATAAASDNIRDPFHPFGKGDLAQIALLTAYAAQMGSADDPDVLLRMITVTPASLMGLTASYGIREGCSADLAVLDAANAEQLLVEGSPSRWVAVQGRWVSALVQEDRLELGMRLE
ncbi:amidohydrolase family protein [Paenibacillus sp. OV219]|uniref:amidohydrolase family protein n=1 Tax=Paenibacillus sp. OV219 TaxID=1884377 RepID=UPI0008D4DBD9|nr:amidohydrolase family protein [Paenibacillus sp. OV219]SEO76797.1 cytosine deaminase [Paenibacillus sp. OV219]